MTAQRPTGVDDLMLGEAPCTCRSHRRYGDKGSPWVEVEYDPGCPYHFPHAAKP